MVFQIKFKAMDFSEPMQEIGQVTGTHGLRGDLKIRLNSGDPDLLLSVRQISLHLPAGDILNLKITRQVLHKGQVLLRFQDYDSINLVERMVGSRVFVAEEELPELKAGEYYWGQLSGLEVIDQDKGTIGHLKDIFTTAAHDTYVVKGAYGEVLIPAVKQFILEVNLERRVMKVSLPQGLVPEEL